jgi:hypothetical protein
MSDILIHGSATQGTSAPTTNPLIYPVARAYQGTSQACIVDLTPPTFAGVTSLTLQSFGQIRVQWGVATDSTTPIKYEIYIKQSDSVNLFYPANIISITDKLLFDVFTLPNGVVLGSGAPYYIGVKAVDAVGNRDNNLAIMNISTTGISSGGATEYEVAGVFNVDTSGNFIGSLWATVNDELVTSLPRLGTASYVIYDKNANLVVGMAESGITPDANGQFTITPVASILDLTANFYTVKATIVVDSLPRNNYLSITGTSETTGGVVYEPRAVFSINASNQLQTSLWITKDGEQLNSGLGTASFTIYDKAGVAVGISQSGLTANGNGVYTSSPVSAANILDLTHYVVLIEVSVDSDIKKGAVGITVAE